jgi:hypothetical protein
MVEALVAIPFFILVFAGSMYTGKVYNQKLYTIAQSRSKAWQAALASCDGSTYGDLNIIDSGDLGAMSKSPLAALCDKGFGSASYSARASAGGVLAFPTQNMTFSTKVTCDETPKTGDFKGAVDFLWDMFAPPDGEVPTTIDVTVWFSPLYGGILYEEPMLL